MRMMQKEEMMFIWNFWSNDICYQNRASNISLSQPQLASLSLIQSFVSLCGPFDSHETKYRHFFSISIFFGIIRNRFETETGASVSMHSNFFCSSGWASPFSSIWPKNTIAVEKKRPTSVPPWLERESDSCERDREREGGREIERECVWGDWIRSNFKFPSKLSVFVCPRLCLWDWVWVHPAAAATRSLEARPKKNTAFVRVLVDSFENWTFLLSCLSPPVTAKYIGSKSKKTWLVRTGHGIEPDTAESLPLCPALHAAKCNYKYV